MNAAEMNSSEFFAVRNFGFYFHSTIILMRHNLSEVTDLIRDRRSLSPESFSKRKVHREIVELALSNATWAPTHGMTQPWRFTAYINEGMQAIGPKLAEWYRIASGDKFSESKFQKLEKRGKHVSALVVIGMVPDPTGRISEQDELLAVACAGQNMYLTCTAHGVGGFWSTPPMINLDEVRSFVGLPDEGRVLGFFYMGYPEKDWPKSHRKPLEYVTQWVEKSPNAR